LKGEERRKHACTSGDAVFSPQARPRGGEVEHFVWQEKKQVGYLHWHSEENQFKNFGFGGQNQRQARWGQETAGPQFQNNRPWMGLNPSQKLEPRRQSKGQNLDGGTGKIRERCRSQKKPKC